MIYLPRSCNQVAHKLASLGANMTSGQVCFWPNLTQIDVLPLVADDLLSASD